MVYRAGRYLVMFQSGFRRSGREVDSMLHSSKRRSRDAELSGSGRYSQSPAVSEHMKPLSKYDNRPRNVELDGNNIVVTAHRRSGPSYRERRVKTYSHKEYQDENEHEVVEDKSSSVSISEFDSDDDDLTQASKGQGAEGGEVEAGSWERVKLAVRDGLKWLMNTSKPRLAVLAAILGLVFGISYRGGLGGLYSGLNLEIYSRGNV